MSNGTEGRKKTVGSAGRSSGRVSLKFPGSPFMQDSIFGEEDNGHSLLIESWHVSHSSVDPSLVDVHDDIIIPTSLEKSSIFPFQPKRSIFWSSH